MQLHFLGGANEVGASCLMLEVAGKKILIDAGIRMTTRKGSQLPDLTRLQELGPPDAILLTHAHTDHIGALPLVHLAYPHMPILCTDPSKALTKVLLQDSLRIMESRWEQEEEVPLYPPHAVEGMLSRMKIVEPGQPISVFGDDSVTANYVPSGHILGACSITLDTPEGVLLFAGDYSLDRQHTIEGMTLPSQTPDLMVTESTYGNRIHSNRRQEEDRLCAAVAEVIAGGGKVLIPSFALGRAQEVILILLNAQRNGQIPPFPVMVDGMVTTMCSVYSQFPQWLTPRLRKWMEKNGGSPFFYPGGAKMVLRTERDKLLKGGPCVIVASSGMLTGGASKMYAEQMVHDPKNAIFITGYQDEESPGHALLALAEEVKEKGEGLLRLDGQTRRVLCKVNRYGLSAHADGGQLLNVVCRMQPKHVVLVHGDDQARETLATTFPSVMQVHLPTNGQTLDVQSFRKQTRPTKGFAFSGLAKSGEPLDLEKLHGHLLSKNGSANRYTIQELVQAWHGTTTPEQIQAVTTAIAAAPHLFKPDTHRAFLFTAVSAKRYNNQAQAKPDKPPTNQNHVIKLATKRLSQLPDFERIGAHDARKTLTIHFDFPDRAATQYANVLEQLSAETGWLIEISPKTNQQALTKVVRETLPLTWDIARTSIFPNSVRAKVRLPANTTQEKKEKIQDAYLKRTGRILEIEAFEEPPPPKNLFDDQGRMEQNAAHIKIRQTLADIGVALLSFGRKNEPAHLELGLISPQIAALHTDLIAQLSQEIGWEIRLRPNPNQVAIITVARQLLPLEWQTTKDYNFNAAEGYLGLQIPPEADPNQVQQIAIQFKQETGFNLVRAVSGK